MKDDLNAKFMFQGIDTSLLLDALKGKINANDLMKNELANRGIGPKGTWVGFDKAKTLWENSYFVDNRWVTIPTV